MDGSLELIEVSKKRRVPRIFNCPETEYNDVKIETKIFTDGEVVKFGEPTEEVISEYYICGKKYTGSVDKLKKTRIFLKNYSYAVVYTLAEEYLTVGNIHGFFKVVQNVNIYLKNKKDITALRKARKTISMVKEHNNSVNYNSLFSMLCASDNSPKKIEYEKYNKNIYTLKK